MNAIASDPLNKKGRLIVLRVAESTPGGLLSAIAYWDLVPIRQVRALLSDVVLKALRLDRHNVDQRPTKYWRDGSVILDPDAVVEPTSFWAGTGRSQKSIKPSKAPIASQ